MAGSSVNTGSPPWKYCSDRSASGPIVFIARTQLTSLVTLAASAWCRETTTAGVHRPGVMPSIVNSSGSSDGVRSVSAI